ncbi:hypothetical protein PAXRUDRAFT_835035 [Paxillus rubicundulus Ve08.2h10]|uniref:Uncharacterized protein n=1 Tax=Paxillus rubicundulus Ve08.2h10 TaxID=930991 RepID=A0A0D0DH39_9AGAM|nr:hypothetical protein PAXRUDRAFT_835035 [Paxillus rubicundulus Ve08.2h10]
MIKAPDFKNKRKTSNDAQATQGAAKAVDGRRVQVSRTGHGNESWTRSHSSHS